MPLGILIPTRNAMVHLPDHLAALRPCLDLAQQIVVVDSESRDGTLDYLKAHLPADRTLFLTHPPGLYQSWNYGIRHIQTPYTYVSTVGDAITPEGLSHLYDVAQRLHADAVVSPPSFINDRGQPIRGNLWPVHRIISFLDLTEPICLHGLVPFIAAISFLPFALLGSSASNLYRTATMQQRPFLTDFGMNGDGAWGVANSLEVRLAITPRCFSHFRKHRKTYSTAAYVVENSDQHIFDFGLRTLQDACAKNPVLAQEAERMGLQNYIDAKATVQTWRSEVMAYRENARFPALWVVNPVAWRARARRISAQRTCDTMIQQLLHTSVN